MARAVSMVPVDRWEYERAKSGDRHPASCCTCGKFYGQHKWASLACPNPRWRPGNGESQWSNNFFTHLHRKVA